MAVRVTVQPKETAFVVPDGCVTGGNGGHGGQVEVVAARFFLAKVLTGELAEPTVTGE